ncbi:MAG: HAMP domain-containing histidine kinase [Firmicutes bacterium]|nr:HAMP domain-containing histidine kinase [Bacillota bacterium]
MINSLKNKMSTRKGFIITVISLVLFNFILVALYYTIYLNKEVNEHHTKVSEQLTKEIINIKEIINESNNQDQELLKYAKEKNITITISNQENELIKKYNSKKKDKTNTNIEVSQIIEIQDTHYLLKLSQRKDILGAYTIIDFLLFELLIIVTLCIFGLIGANKKILEPLSQLSKDFSKYKLGILPKKRKVRSGIDFLQNDFVELVDKLEEEKQKQNTIIASISHDIKTPLTSILGYSELATKESTSTKSKERYINTIHNQALVMKEIIEEFDDYLSCNIKDEKKVEKLSISHLVDYLNAYYKEDLKEKNIEFKIKTNCQNLIIEIDLSKFKRVFSNIITNSIRHYDKDKKILNININEEKNGKIKFEIADNGSGCKEDLVKIFDPLYTTDKSRKISGLGLSICKEIIESHNGTIKAMNNKLGGFSIIFTIDSYKED